MWLPHVTVAVVIEKNKQFLMVEEIDHGKKVLNQPAGHIEEGESFFTAAIRETLEETRWSIELTSSLGISRYRAPNGHTYFRHSFVGNALEEHTSLELDQDIIDVKWMTLEEIIEAKPRLRSSMVLDDFNRYLSGTRFPLEIYIG